MQQENLRQLARLYGVFPSYLDVWRRRRFSSDEALLRTLRLLGAPVERPEDAADALRARRVECWRKPAEPTLTAWEGRPAQLRLRMKSADVEKKFRCRIGFEDGGREEFERKLSELPRLRQRTIEGSSYEARLLSLPERLPRGYHRCEIEFGGSRAEVLVIAAPERSYAEPPGGRRFLWGVFLPLYALYRDVNWGAGDFSDLEALMQWTAQRGGSLVATLPQLSTLWELGADPSPYSAASRLFWNEYYLDPRRIPELESCAAARDMLASADDEARQGRANRGDLVDYSGQMALKRRIIELLCGSFFERPSPRRDQLERFRHEHAELDLFARFRAVGEKQGKFWPDWPEPLSSGTIRPGDYDERTYQYHLYAQWQTEEQLDAMSRHAEQLKMLWYLDFPLGVSGAGYDVWREREVFVREAAGGAPPDAFFTKGQNWGFPPFDPQKLREQGYRHLIAALRRHLKYARVLRFDHIMGLYRFYWVPNGLEATDGAYVRYPAEDLFAILTLESHRYKARIVGENLGTVPPVVDERIARHGIEDMYVVQYEAKPDRKPIVRPAGARSVASVNTHDMPQFAAYWTGLDVDDRLQLGLLDEQEAIAEWHARARLRRQMIEFLKDRGLIGRDTLDPERILEACLAYLASGPAPMVLVNLEDLWLETDPQNTPGTFMERPNWRRKARRSFEEFTALPGVRRILHTVDRLRREAEKPAEPAEG